MPSVDEGGVLLRLIGGDHCSGYPDVSGPRRIRDQNAHPPISDIQRPPRIPGSWVCSIGVSLARSEFGWLVTLIELNQFRVARTGAATILYMRALTMQKPGARRTLCIRSSSKYQAMDRQDDGLPRARISGREVKSRRTYRRGIRRRTSGRSAGRFTGWICKRRESNFRGRTKSQNWLAREGLRRYVERPCCSCWMDSRLRHAGQLLPFQQAGQESTRQQYVHFTVFLSLELFDCFARQHCSAGALKLAQCSCSLWESISFHALFTHGLCPLQ